MRKLKLQVQTSVNGFIARPDGGMDWMIWDHSEDAKAFIIKLHEPVDTIVLGRKLADGFIPYWAEAVTKPETNDIYARRLNATPKIVFSRSKSTTDQPNTVMNNGDLVTEINKLKAQPGGDIIAYGGAEFVTSLIHNGLIDELNLCVNPTAIPTGMSIFDQETKLELVGAQAFTCGTAVLTYKPKV